MFGETGQRIKLKLMSELEVANWQTLFKLYELLFGESLKDTIGTETFESFQFQIRLRNLISHGQTVSLKMSSRDNSIANMKVVFVRSKDSLLFIIK